MTPTAGPPFTHLVEARSRLDGRKNWPGNRGDEAVLATLLELETQGWRALSSDAEVAKEFYEHVLRDDAVMLLPGGTFLEGKESILASLDAQPWSTFDIEGPRVLKLGEAVAVLAYRVTARREGSTAYAALISSTYHLEDGTWRLALHQHTPI